MNSKNASVTLILRKSRKEDKVNYRSVSLMLVYGMVMEQIILETISKLIKD